MSNFRRLLFVFIAFVLLVQVLPSPSANANQAIVFGDPLLEQEVRDKLSLPGGPITEDDMKSLEYLFVPALAKGEVKSLQGLEYAVNLSNLTISNNKIKDLTPLSQLTNLTRLDLTNNLISDLSPLAALTELKELYIKYNLIKDIRPLTRLSKLETLQISSNQISDLSPLVSILSLSDADVQENFIDVKADMNQSALASLAQRQVNLAGLENQQKPPYEPQISWTKQSYEEQEAYEPSHYAYGNGVYVSSDQLTSTDGIHWTSHERNDKERFFYKVVFGKGLFLGIGLGSNHGIPVWTSKDGVNWSKETVIRMGANFTDVVFTGKRFVVISSYSNDYNIYKGVLATSEDGVTWKVHPTELERNAHLLASGNGVVLALTDKSLFKSNDGISWRKVTLPIKSLLNDILFIDGKFVATASGALLYSTDGTKWTVTSTSSHSWGAVVWVKGRFFTSSFNPKTKTAAYMTSTDGKSWSVMKVPGADLILGDIKFEKSKYICRSYWAHFSSEDGVNWKLIKKITRMPNMLNRSAIGDGKLVAVGGLNSVWGYFRVDASGKVAYNRVDDKYPPLNDVIWTGKQFFAVGDQGIMMTSKDGINWAKVDSPTKESMFRVIRANDTYYVTGTNGLIMSSRDLKTWKKQKLNTNFNIVSIAWSGKKFIAVSEYLLSTEAFQSDNGTDWKPANINIKTSDSSFTFRFTDIAWGNGTFVITVAQNYHLDLPYTVFLSTDGTQWKKIPTEYKMTAERNWSPSLYGVHFLGGQFVSVGNNGSVYLSKDGKEWNREEIPYNDKVFSAQLFNGKLYAFGLGNEVYIGEFNKP
ncbi:leucine-rich repeat domain-containing protein [Cohnella abietis]|uniref:Photosynthesis system II assembly factor Ycf48/Hcf136-like domain-containing protein n=1 Tax=Cohnella abietis TaxID=2507935 RepID=A0A3T1CY99_9BACL|nr:leucine-rich repeat domain-containing protein [Cohnella abietis]BBI30816.1 hypothetical protein KCTCHS21_02150 [Cohnella abietis]